ncbi:MAG: sulfotransferase domain-containing protein [Halobacteriales archaeon]|nr:sulfotransferase domain-containing protein [Halobacteriales archaeon]
MRSGSTVQYQLVASLVERTGTGQRVEWVRPDQFEEQRGRYDDRSGWLVFKTHRLTDAMRQEFEDGGAHAVFVYRDLRDAAASLVRKDGRDQVDVRRFVKEQLRNYRQWTSCPRVLVSRYEDMITNLDAEVRRIAAHLGIACDAALVDSIASEHTLDRQRRRIANADPDELRTAGKHVFDRATLLHTDHIQSGFPGGWVETLTDDDLIAIDELAGTWLEDHGYTS